MNFAGWMTAGVAFGFKAFFAVFVFLLCCGCVLGLIGGLLSMFGVGKDEE
jgi:hypothetical protein